MSCVWRSSRSFYMPYEIVKLWESCVLSETMKVYINSFNFHQSKPIKMSCFIVFHLVIQCPVLLIYINHLFAKNNGCLFFNLIICNCAFDTLCKWLTPLCHYNSSWLTPSVQVPCGPSEPEWLIIARVRKSFLCIQH